MLVDPPLQYHLPQHGWIRLNRAIDGIPEIREEFVDWLEYGLADALPNATVLDIDFIEVTHNELCVIFDGSGLHSPPPPPGSASEDAYRAIERCAWRAERVAAEALNSLVSDGRTVVFARKHEHDADLQQVPAFVWSAMQHTSMREASATLPSGKTYYDVHLQLQPELRSEAEAQDLTVLDEDFSRAAATLLVTRLEDAMRAKAPSRLKKEEAKSLLGFVKDRRAKLFMEVWRTACGRLNPLQEAGAISFVGRYGEPSGNPAHIKDNG